MLLNEIFAVLKELLANITGTGGWDSALQKAKAFLKELTLEEKVNVVTGKLSNSRSRGVKPVGTRLLTSSRHYGSMCWQHCAD